MLPLRSSPAPRAPLSPPLASHPCSCSCSCSQSRPPASASDPMRAPRAWMERGGEEKQPCGGGRRGVEWQGGAAGRGRWPRRRCTSTRGSSRPGTLSRHAQPCACTCSASSPRPRPSPRASSA
eukprot:3481780-Rhodomonas_salina.1